MAKKLLNLSFMSASGRLINLGANSTDNIKDDNPTFHTRYRSDEKPLNQIGCCITPQNHPFSTGHGGYKCVKALNRAGYGARLLCPESSLEAEAGVHYTLIPQYPTDEPLPYLVLRTSGVTLHGPSGSPSFNLFSIVSGGGYSLSAFCGQIFEDGTFTGDLVAIFPHEILSTGLFSTKIYEWQPNQGVYHYDNYQLINPSAIDYLREFYPIDPEGEFVPEGVGDFDSTSDTIDIPDTPTLSAIDTGMLRLYRMNETELRNLNNFLWSGLFDIDTFKKLFSDPMQAILNLSISPIDATTTDSSVIKIGNITSNVTGSPVTAQYKKIDFGTIRLNEFWGNFADYSPYTRLSIYLPYVGTQSISIDDVMNGTLHLVAICDVLTGSITYMLQSNQINRAGHSHNSVLYSWGGNCQYQIPLTANNMASVISSIVSITGTVAGTIGAAVATGGLTAPMAGNAIASAVGNVMNAKTQIQRGGGIGGSTGIFGVQKPYLILERPEQRTITNYNSLIGEVSDYTARLSFFEGFVKVKAVHIDNISTATDNEKNEIENLLKTGVFV